jgi:hypothetical protein
MFSKVRVNVEFGIVKKYAKSCRIRILSLIKINNL